MKETSFASYADDNTSYVTADNLYDIINPIQDEGERAKSPIPYQFFPCNFYKRRN